jgi:hypothetical protein
MCQVFKRCGAGCGVAVGAGAGEQCGDDAGGGVGDGDGDGDHDGGPFQLGPVDALDVERGGDDFLQRAGGLGEQSQRVRQFIDQVTLISVLASGGVLPCYTSCRTKLTLKSNIVAARHTGQVEPGLITTRFAGLRVK